MEVGLVVLSAVALDALVTRRRRLPAATSPPSPPPD